MRRIAKYMLHLLGLPLRWLRHKRRLYGLYPHERLRQPLYRLERGPHAGILWARTNNLGDDVQSIAQQQLLDELEPSAKRVFVDRERLKFYGGPPITLLMNAWFMHNGLAFPPPETVRPVFVSFHLNARREDFLKRHLEYFKSHAPIGCRDDGTREMLKARGVDAYTSKCLSLLLEPPPPDAKREGVYLVDLCDSELNKVSYIENLDEKLLRCIPPEIMERGVRVTHELPPGFSPGPHWRMAAMRALLNKYRTAELVITARLHCALPCRAFGTPVIFLHTKYDKDRRFDGMRHILRGTSEPFDFDEMRRVVDIDADKKELRERVFKQYAEAARGAQGESQS